MARSEPVAQMSYEEYAAYEEASDARHEFLESEVFAMAGGRRSTARCAWRWARSSVRRYAAVLAACSRRTCASGSRRPASPRPPWLRPMVTRKSVAAFPETIR
jgi:hypothetical protein